MQTKEILTKPIPQLLKDIALPASTGIIFNTLFNVVDTYYAGYISTNAVAGLSISFFLYFMIIGVGYGFSSALTALVGNALGKHKRILASIYAHKGIFFILLLGIFVGSLGFAFSKELLILVGAKKEYLPFALTYIDTILLSAPFFLLNAGLNALLVSLGDTKTYRNILILGFFANLILDPLFVFGIGGFGAMGIAGIAFATVLIQILSSFYLALKVLKTNLIGLHVKQYLPKISIYKQILSQGTPPALNMITMSLGSILIVHYVTFYGMDAVAGFGIAFRVQQIILLPVLGLNSAVLSLVSNNYGAKLYDRVKDSIKYSLLVGGTIGVVGIIITFTFGENLLNLFSKNPEVLSFGVDYLYVEVLNIFGYVSIFICVSTLQGIKKPKVIFYVGLYRQIIAIIPIFWLIAVYFKLPFINLWFGLMFVVYSSAIFLLWYTRRMLKRVC